MSERSDLTPGAHGPPATWAAAGLRKLLWIRPPAGNMPAGLLVAAAFAATTAAFLGPVVGQGMVPAGQDPMDVFMFYKLSATHWAGRGELASWGLPSARDVALLADPRAALLYPPDVLFYLLPPEQALRVGLALHVFLAAAFTYLFARLSFGLSALGAWLAGTTFGFGGFVGAHIGHPSLLHGLVWLPAMMLCLEQAAACSRRGSRGLSGNPGAVALGAIALAMQVFAGHILVVGYSLLALALFALYLAFAGSAWAGSAGVSPARGLPAQARRLRSRPLPPQMMPFAALGGIVAMGLALAGVQLAPALDPALQSFRVVGPPHDGLAVPVVQIPALLDTILPLYVQLPPGGLVAYTGVVSLALIPAAVAGGRQRSARWFLGGLALLALAMSTVDSDPVLGWPRLLAPGFDPPREPGVWLLLYSLSVSLLAGAGLDALLVRRPPEGLARWLAGYAAGLGAAVLALAALRLWLGSRGLDLALPPSRVVLTWGLLFVAGMGIAFVAAGGFRQLLAVALLASLVVLDLHLARAPVEYVLPSGVTALASGPTDAPRMGAVPISVHAGMALSVAGLGAIVTVLVQGSRQPRQATPGSIQGVQDPPGIPG